MYRSGLIALDKALAQGNGLPSATMLELYGSPDSGKTALALWFCRYAQQSDLGPVGWVQVESAIKPRNFEWAGVNPDEVVLVRQDLNFPGLTAAEQLLDAGCKLVVVDSIAALMSGDITDPTPLSIVVSSNLYRVKRMARAKEGLVIFTNQERMFPKGRMVYHAGDCFALNRLLDYRIRLRSGEGLYRGGQQTGVRIHFNIVKNGPDTDDWGREGRFSIYYDQGLKDLRNEKQDDKEGD